MKRLFILIFFILSITSCTGRVPQVIPQGTWQYLLLMNGVEIGTASVSNKQTKTHHISTVQMDMTLGKIKNSTRQVITETIDFKPVKLEIYNTVTNDDNVQKINTVAEIKGKKIILTAGETKTETTIEKPFILDGNYFMNFFINKKFKKGTQASAYLYDPTFETEEPIRVTMTVAGRESVTINGRKKTLIHLVQRIENSKNIDIYINEAGIAQKAVILMLNNRIELIKK